MLDTSTLSKEETDDIKLARSYTHLLPHFKILILGYADTGKTSLIQRYINNEFFELVQSSLGLDFREKKVQISEKEKIVLKLWDTAGSEKFRSIAQNYFTNSDGIILCFDSSDKETFDNLNGWVNYINEYVQILDENNTITSNNNRSSEGKREEEEYEEDDEKKVEIPWMEEQNYKPIIVLCGTKADLDVNEIEDEDINNFKNKIKCEYFLTSSKTGEGIDDLFNYLAKELFNKKEIINKCKSKSFKLRNKRYEKNDSISDSKIGCC